MSEEKPRPPRRKARLDVPVDPYTLDDARKKAGSLKALRAVVRAFLKLWGAGEYPDLPKDVVEQEMKRAKKRKKE